MIKGTRGVLVCLLLSGLLACSSMQGGSQESTNGPRKNVMVQFTDMTIHPSTAQITSGGTVVWVNYAATSAGVVFFPEASTKGFTCTDPRPIFSQVAGGWQSQVLPVNGLENVTLPCPMKPGTYPYELLLNNDMGLEGAGVYDPSVFSNPTNSLKGTIVAQ